MFLHLKKSQATIFLIAAVAVIIGIFTATAINRAHFEKASAQEVKDSEEIAYNAEPIQNFVEQCLSSISKDGMDRIGKQNGRLFVGQGSIMWDYNEADEGERFARYNGFKVAFSEEGIMPLMKTAGKNSFQEQLEHFVIGNIDKCVKFSLFEKQGMRIYAGEKNVNASINEGDVLFVMEYPIEITGQDSSIKLSRFSSKHEVRLAKIYQFVNEIYGKSIEDIENIAVSGNIYGFEVKSEKNPAEDYIVSIIDPKSKINGLEYSYHFAKKNNGPASAITGAAVSGANNLPIANAGQDRNVETGKITRLFGFGSDADKDQLAFKWQAVDKPGGSFAALSKDDAASPTFIPDLDGDYMFRLRVNDGSSFSEPSTVRITSKPAAAENIKPFSFAGYGRNANINEKITLTGYGFDENKDSLAYMWYFAATPGGKAQTLDDASTQSPSFIPLGEGDYTLGIVANDGKADSLESIVTVKASKPLSNGAPTADPGYDKFVHIGEKANLLGAGYDPDKNNLNFFWSFQSKPTGSIAALSAANVPNTSFVPDIGGEYTFSLSVDDGKLESAQNIVKYTAKTPAAGNTKPVSNPAPSLSIIANKEEHIQGSGSDANNDPLYYRWAIIQAPANKTGALSNPNAQNQIFTAYAEGNYILGLLVNDGKADSDLKTLAITALPGALCTQGTCDLEKKQWCNGGQFTSDGYCGACGNNDSSCASCTGNSCDTQGQKWCEDGKWKNGTYSNYCSRCGYADASCPACESGTCDLPNKVWCQEKKWSAANYCENCGKFDSLCKLESCTEKACDAQSKSVCINNTWKKTDYCLTCGSLDSSCFFECTIGSCDISAKKWCSNGTWTSENYCAQCGAKDFSCGGACQSSLCDTAANKWCSTGAWDSLNYCSKCQDSECLNACTNGACDTNTKKWCSKGTWIAGDYCTQCGAKDFSCSAVCQEGTCDITANKRCYNAAWVSSNYCNSCSLRDKDCSIGCVEGQCDVKNKLVCASNKWAANSTYCEVCSNLDASCKAAQCSSGEDGCCLEKQDSACDLDCEFGKDIDCKNQNLTCSTLGACALGEACLQDAECSSEICKEGKCSAAACDDTIKNGNETGVDCGGECGACYSKKICSLNSDCATGICSLGLCEEQDTCDDGIKNGNETGIDCGGECADECELEKECILDSDCDSGLVCASNLCSEEIEEADESEAEKDDATQDTDKDGTPDQWEIKYGLNPNDNSDATIDSDEDGLLNIKEYSLGTNPKNADSDGDKATDKEEIDKGTNPLDVVSRPRGIAGILFAVIVMIIIFGAGSYIAYYYKDKLMMLLMLKQKENAFGGGPGYYNAPPASQARPALQKAQQRADASQLVKKREAEKEKGRKIVFEAFEDGKQPPKLGDSIERSFEKGASGNNFKAAIKNGEDQAFSRLKSISEKRKDK